VKKIENKGMPTINGSKRGDIYLIFNIIFPKELNN
jgi:DnaJ-class molecular chaperone